MPWRCRPLPGIIIFREYLCCWAIAGPRIIGAMMGPFGPRASEVGYASTSAGRIPYPGHQSSCRRGSSRQRNLRSPEGVRQTYTEHRELIEYRYIYIYMYACIFLLLYSSLVPYFHLLLLSILKMLHTRHIWGHGLDDLLPPEGTALRMALPEEVRYDVTEGE